jgi:hypothetical protein
MRAGTCSRKGHTVTRVCEQCKRPFTVRNWHGQQHCSSRCAYASFTGRAEYVPTVEEIRAMCLVIQAGWTPEEREARRATSCLCVETPTVQVLR